MTFSAKFTSAGMHSGKLHIPASVISWLAGSLLLGLAINCGAQSNLAVIRIACEGSNANAEVFIDNKFKGECPVDIQIPEGAYTLRVAKAIDANRELRFEQKIRIVAGTVRRIDIALSGPVLTPEAIAREAAEKLKAQEVLRAITKSESEELKELTAAAATGSPQAAFELGRFLEKGGVSFRPDFAKAKPYYESAASKGHLGALFALHFDQGWRKQAAQKFKEWPDIQKLLTVLTEHHGNIGAPQPIASDSASQLEEYLSKSPFFNQMDQFESENFKYRSFLANLLPVRLVMYEAGLFSKTLIKEIKSVDSIAVWGDPEKNILEQPGPWGFSLVRSELWRADLDLGSKANAKPYQLYCARLPDAKHVKPLTDSQLQGWNSTREAWEVAPFHCLQIERAHFNASLHFTYQVVYIRRDLRAHSPQIQLYLK